MKNKVQLIAYVDRFSAGGLRELQHLLDGPCAGLFGGVHLLPFFWPIDGADAGFDPIDHTKVDPRLGSWDGIRSLSGHLEIMADVIVNHISARSPQYLDFHNQGDESPFAGMFLTLGRVFPGGVHESDLLRIYRPRPGLPFTKTRLANGVEHLLWTTFTSEQIDIDVHHPAGSQYLTLILDEFHGAGIRVIRLDAVGYAIKKPGTSCFMIPETFDFIAELRAQANTRGTEVLVEIHAHYQDQIEIARQCDWVYDFALPPLVLHTLYSRDARHLKSWLEIAPRNAVTVLDTHDGIGVLDVGPTRNKDVELPGLLPSDQIDALVETIHERSKGASRQATGAAASNLDLYQVNCTFYDALGACDDEYLIARAIQFFAPGVPQVYYVGLLAGSNDIELLRRTGVGRDINRHYYTPDDLREQLDRPVVRSLFELIRFRNTHPAFQGDFHLLPANDHALRIEWRHGADMARLDVDLEKMSASVTRSTATGQQGFAITKATPLEARQ
ncbi:MAG TPA: sucrose phosphorylase [Bryobacteraceae bacterium]|nr:sucrose phosphorylase [Bryobacteraceae bacterium]